MENQSNQISFTHRLLRFIKLRILRPYIINPVQKTFIWNIIRLIFAIIYEKIIHIILFFSTSSTKDTSVSNKKPAKVLIIYSKNHFNPFSIEQAKQYSASNLARNIYQIFTSKNVELTYIDQKEKTIYKDMDLIIGILSKSFIRNCKANPKAKKILFLVNSHPIFRLKQLLKESMRNKIMFSPFEYASPFVFLRALLCTNRFIAIGNDFVAKTFLQRGVKSHDISVINSGVNLENINYKPKDVNGKIRFLYSAGNISIRKGIFPLLNTWNTLDKDIQSKIELIILGNTDNPAISKRISDATKYHNNIQNLGWIESNTDKYKEILQSCHGVIFPSLEEGQVGSVLEAMSAGCVPIISENCGIPIEDKVSGYIIKNIYDTKEIHRYISEIVDNKIILKNMSLASRKYIETNHSWSQFKDNLIKAINS